MSLAEIKKKYKQILENSDEDSSEETPHQVPSKPCLVLKQVLDLPDPPINTQQSIMQMRAQALNSKENTFTKSVTPSNRNQSPFKHPLRTNQQEVIALRQRLAQATSDLQAKTTQINKQLEMRKTFLDQKHVAERLLEELRQQLAKKDQETVQRQARLLSLEKELADVKAGAVQKDINCQMLEKQIQFYKLEQTKIKQLVKQKQTQFSQAKKLKSKSNSILTQNQRLKADIQRLVSIINQQQRYRNIFKDSVHFDDSFLGKPHTQPENWYPRDLIRQTQTFLKDQKIPLNNNKDFLPSLVKFIEYHNRQTARHTSTQLKKKYETRAKDAERKLNHSYNFKEVYALNTMTTTCGLYQSRLTKAKRNTEAFDRSAMKHSGVWDKHNHSVHSQDNNKFESIKELTEEFKSGVKQLSTSQKEAQPKKILKLADWLCESIYQLCRPRKDSLKFSITEI